MEETQVKGRRERSGKDPLTNYSGGADFEYVPCTESDRTVPSADRKGRIRLEVYRADPSCVIISPFVDELQKETHQGQSHGLLRRGRTQDTYARLEQTCRDVVRDLAEGVKRQQEKINCLLLELEAAKREQRHSPSQENAHETRRMEHQGRTAEQEPRGHHSESRAWQS